MLFGIGGKRKSGLKQHQHGQTQKKLERAAENCTEKTFQGKGHGLAQERKCRTQKQHDKKLTGTQSIHDNPPQ